MKKAVGFDIDGVLYDWHASVHDYFVVYKGYKGSYDDFWSNYKTIMSDADWKEIVDAPFLYMNRFPEMGSVEFLKKLAETYEIYYITFRPKSAENATREFLRKYEFPFKENLIFTDKKAEYAEALDLAYFVEDRKDYIEPLSLVTNVILRARIWNKDIQGKYPTAHSFEDMAKLMEVE